MATRAERFKAELQRSGPKRETSSSKRATATPKRATGAGAAPGEKAGAKGRGGVKATASGKTTVKEGRLKSGRGTYVLEPPETTARPSRKSTRKSKAHVKSGTELTTRTQLRAQSPQSRHARRS